jgi:hypothetical protein
VGRDGWCLANSHRWLQETAVFDQDFSRNAHQNLVFALRFIEMAQYRRATPESKNKTCYSVAQGGQNDTIMLGKFIIYLKMSSYSYSWKPRYASKTYLEAKGWSGPTSGRWSASPNIVANSRDEIILDYSILVDTQAGDDTITSGGGGIGRYGTGITVESGAQLRTGAGNDKLKGNSSEGTGIYNNGIIGMGDGNDSIEGSGGYIGIKSSGTGLYDLGNGDNYVSAVGNVWGIYVNKLIAGSGKDVVRAEAAQYAIQVQYLDVGDGDDIIYGKGGTFAGELSAAGVGLTCNTLITGKGNDFITGINAGARNIRFGQGIWLPRTTDFIDTGDGNDTITGSSFGGSEINCGIDNNGAIRTGPGMDVVDARNGGLRGSGLFDLGSDNDTLIGYGISTGSASNPNFIGGLGTDKILLNAGSYKITNGTGFGRFNIQMIGASLSSGSLMRTSGFELIGSVSSLLTKSLVTGTITISSSGTLAYQHDV